MVANAETHAVTIIDAATAKVRATIAVGGAPEYMATDLNGTGWVNLADRDALAILDLKSEKLKGTTPLPGYKEPTALAIDRKKGRLYVGCRNKVMADRVAAI